MRVLIIGSLRGYSTMAAKIAISKGAKVSLTTTVEEALNTLRIGKGAELILIDLSLDVKKLVTHLTEERFSIPVISCGIASDPKQAADTIRAGAKDYIPLPPDAELIAAVFGAIAREDKTFICQDPKMLNLLKLVAKVAPSEANILITGESGTGKEVLANYLHHQSNRCDKIFVSLNCAAIPENLLESELFGHEKGAFTGAIARRIGKFEEADGGTLFLDEISEMHSHLQAKLLRAIQEKTIDRVGGNQPIKVNIRIIATSNRNLLEAVQQKQFREDLYFRLNVVNLHIPPLRERSLDIIPLAEHFIEKYTHLNQLDSRTISLTAQQKLQSHDWQGNVRELENTIHRAVLLSQTSVLEIEDIFGYSQHSSINHTNDNQLVNASLVGRTVSEVERELILGTLSHCLGNRTHAANILGISIRTLRNKLKEYNDNQLTPAPIVKQG